MLVKRLKIMKNNKNAPKKKEKTGRKPRRDKEE